MVSAAIELYINMLLSDRLRWPYSHLGSSFLLLSSILLTSLSLNLQALRELAITQSPGFLKPSERESIHLKLISHSLGRLIVFAVLSVVSVGIGILFLGFAITGVDC